MYGILFFFLVAILHLLRVWLWAGMIVVHVPSVLHLSLTIWVQFNMTTGISFFWRFPAHERSVLMRSIKNVYMALSVHFPAGVSGVCVSLFIIGAAWGTLLVCFPPWSKNVRHKNNVLLLLYTHGNIVTSIHPKLSSKCVDDKFSFIFRKGKGNCPRAYQD